MDTSYRTGIMKAFTGIAAVASAMALAASLALPSPAALANQASDQSKLAAQEATSLSASSTETQNAVASELGLKSGHIYTIRSAVRTKASLDVGGASVKNGANVDVSTFARKLGQQWVVKIDAEGYATFKSVLSGKYLDVAGGSKKSKTNVWQYAKNGTLAQKWKIEKNENGTYRITSALNPKLSLHVRGAQAADGANVQVNRTKDVANQQWKFRDVTSVRDEMNALAKKNEGSVAPGTYALFSKVCESAVLDIYGGKKSSGANAQIYTCNGSAAQMFTIAYDKKGFATIKNSSGKYLGVTDARGKSGANVKQYTKNNSLAQRWILFKNSDKTIEVRSALWPNLSLDVAGALPYDFTNVQIYESNGTDAQKWQLRTPEQAQKLARKWAPITGLNGSSRSSFNGISLVGAKAAGIDVSFWNGNIDWNKVAASGVRFAIIRCGYGDNYSSQDDSKFLDNVKGARAAGLDIGVYLYSHAVRTTGANSSSSEADHTLRMLNAAGLTPSKLKYGVYYDIEAPDQANANLTKVCKDYCRRIKNAGYSVGVYSSLSWWNSKLTNSAFDRWNRWVAQWPYKTGNRTCDYQKRYNIWQCMSDGSVPGIVGRVDMNLAY